MRMIKDTLLSPHLIRRKEKRPLSFISCAFSLTSRILCFVDSAVFSSPSFLPQHPSLCAFSSLSFPFWIPFAHYIISYHCSHGCHTCHKVRIRCRGEAEDGCQVWRGAGVTDPAVDEWSPVRGIEWRSQQQQQQQQQSQHHQHWWIDGQHVRGPEGRDTPLPAHQCPAGGNDSRVQDQKVNHGFQVHGDHHPVPLILQEAGSPGSRVVPDGRSLGAAEHGQCPHLLAVTCTKGCQVWKEWTGTERSGCQQEVLHGWATESRRLRHQSAVRIQQRSHPAWHQLRQHEAHVICWKEMKWNALLCLTIHVSNVVTP